MRSNRNRIFDFSLFFAFCLCSTIPLFPQKPTVQIGLVLDGPSELNERYAAIFREEISVVLSDEYDVEIPPERILVGDWTAPRVTELIDRLLQETSVDAVVAVGLVASVDLARRQDLPKPCFAARVIDPSLSGIPSQRREEPTGRPGEMESYRVSSVKNLNYLLPSDDEALQSVARFREVVPFSNLSVLVAEAFLQAIPQLESELRSRLLGMQLNQVEVVPVRGSAAAALAAIPNWAEAVMVTSLLHLPSAEFNKLVEGLNTRSLPTLSTWGRDDVSAGLLASFRTSDDPVRRARRIALNLQEALKGADPGEMSVEFGEEAQLALNMETARKIGVSPRYTVLLEADLIKAAVETYARSLSLGSVVREASVMNLDLAAAERSVSAGDERVQQAWAPLLPQVDLGAGYTLFDKDRARAFPTIGETELTVSLEASQLIYSDRTWANYTIEKHLQTARIAERDQLRLDVINEASAAYLDLLRAQTIRQIQSDNLELTRSNLRLAESRVEVGVAGREELFRWQSQVATNQRDLFSAGAVRNQARIAVNRVLNRPLNESFNTVEPSLTDPEFVSNFSTLGAYIDNPRGFTLFGEFMAAEAIAAAPELRQFEAAVLAVQRDLERAQRSFFIPDLFLSGGVRSFELGGAGSELPPGLNNTDWFVGVNARIPIFNGTGRLAEVARLKLELEQVQLQRDAARQRVEQRIRSLLESTSSSFVGIELSRVQEVAAKQTLDLVTDSYAEGVVGILELLDAQNQALVANLVAANAVFEYLSDLMSVQRAVGKFDYFRTPEERQAFLVRLNQFYAERGMTVR